MKEKTVRRIFSLCCAAIFMLLLTGCNPAAGAAEYEVIYPSGYSRDSYVYDEKSPIEGSSCYLQWEKADDYEKTYDCDIHILDENGSVLYRYLESQTMYQDVRDGYAVYFFKEDAEAPVLELCETKDYVIDQHISLEMPGTARAWTDEDEQERFLAESGAYVKLVLRFTDDLDTEMYAEYLYDFLNSVDQLECNLLLQAKANKIYIFHEELNILDGFDASIYTVEDLRQKIEVFLSMSVPQ